ncbi:hypothetical protein [Sinomonas gamaensis]|uniref:hypothetical protein n=1 Tax=Sinomonas gamaensis TaxID=2565624 RepID=UPI0023AF73DC|nr:hypothetical protein [Sinomonas gamaensis]
MRQEGRGIGLYAKLDAYAFRTAGWTPMRPRSPWAEDRTNATTGRRPRCSSPWGHEDPAADQQHGQGRPDGRLRHRRGTVTMAA